MVSIFREKDKAKLFNRLESRKSLASGEIAAAAREVVDAVRREGDRALVRFTEKFDKVRLTAKRLRIPAEELRATAQKVDPSLRKDMKKAIANALAYHKRQVQKSWQIKKRDVVLGQRVAPLDSVGVYIPGGSAAYPSSVWMNVVPAKIASVPRIVAVTPPSTFEQHPIIAAALDELGVKEVYRVGGAQAVAALAYGTATVPRVDKIVGPGNAYVTAAKREVFGEVDIDMIAGPSEILILSTTESNPRFIAADMLSQAEHDAYACSICFTDSMPHAVLIQREVEAQLAVLPRREIAKKSLDNYGAIVVLDNYMDYVDWVNDIAPEHLEIYSSIPQSVIGKVRHAGAIFYGDYTPEAVGDYFAGSNHVLPTTGTARFFSPLGVYHFQRKTGIIRYSQAELERTWKSIDALAREEGLDAHARSVTIRITGGKGAEVADIKSRAAKKK
ncbi:MAG: histidinol dehydrogenase [Acidobacteriota bacterium]|jgi:histidinol dehydrogenase|nr:histidinol dehydrogenase [Acidobacteriota bacterium]